MGASDKSPRRRRYTRQPVEQFCSLTPLRRTLLTTVAAYRIVSLPQLARRCGLSLKSARRHLRLLFDAGLVTVVAVSRAALADPGQDDLALLFGSAPNIYTLTATGARLLYTQGLLESPQPPPRYGPQNSLFLAHELLIRDVRVWLELTAAATGQTLGAWRDGPAAVIPLERSKPQAVQPDAWFTVPVGAAVLVGLLEADRGTERGCKRWGEKLRVYQALYTSGRLKAVTGYANARVLVVTTSTGRRDRLADLIVKQAPPDLAARFWLAERSVLERPDLTAPVWRQPGRPEHLPLVPPERLPTSGASERDGERGR